MLCIKEKEAHLRSGSNPLATGRTAVREVCIVALDAVGLLRIQDVALAHEGLVTLRTLESLTFSHFAFVHTAGREKQVNAKGCEFCSRESRLSDKATKVATQQKMWGL